MSSKVLIMITFIIIMLYDLPKQLLSNGEENRVMVIPLETKVFSSHFSETIRNRHNLIQHTDMWSSISCDNGWIRSQATHRRSNVGCGAVCAPRDASHYQIMNNTELINIKKILGLSTDKIYKNTRYKIER